MKKLLIGLIISCNASFLLADELALKEGHPETYIVKKGDTLWDISGLFLSNPWLWPEIWHENPQIEDPHWIYPGDKLALIYMDGIKGADGKGSQARLTVVERGPVRLKPGTAKLTPQIRRSEVSAAIPAIPLEKINAFLSKSRIVSLDDLDRAPYVIAGSARRLMAGAGDNIYARGSFDEKEKVYGVYRAGQTYFDPITREGLGVEALDIGAGRIISRKADVATFIVNESHEEVRINDRLMPSEQKKVTATFHPKAPDMDIAGQILAVEGGVSQVGPLDVVMLNRGEREGIEEGHVLAIEQAGEVVKDRVRNELIQLPDVRAGLLIVFRTFDKMSYALVVSANRPLRVGDRVAKP